MMHSYHLWGFPNFRRTRYPNYAYYRPKYSVHNNNNNSTNNNLNKSTNNNFSNDTCNNSDNFINDTNNFNFINYTKNNTEKIDFSCDNNYYSDNECFNIFGLSLHIDDLLILALLFFLYKEGSDDIYLYIVLFILLLS